MPSMNLLHVEQKLAAGARTDVVATQETRHAKYLLEPCLKSDRGMRAWREELAKRPKDPEKDIKPIIRSSDEMTCLRAPIDPLSPKSQDVVAMIKPLSDTKDPRLQKWPERWYPPKEPTTKDVLKEAQKLAYRREFAHDEYLRWQKEKSRSARQSRQATHAFFHSRDQRTLHRKLVSAARFKEWKARKDLHDIDQQLAKAKQQKKVTSCVTTQSILRQKLEVRWLKSRRQLALLLRENVSSLVHEVDGQHTRTSRPEDDAEDDSSGKDSTNNTDMSHGGANSERETNNLQEKLHISRINENKLNVKKTKDIGTLSLEESELNVKYNEISPAQRALGFARLTLAQDKCNLKGKFDALDTCADAKLTEHELCTLLGSVTPDITIKDAHEVFVLLDHDASGAISYFELDRAVRDVPQKLCDFLQRYRRNQDRKRRFQQKEYYRNLKSKLSKKVLGRLRYPEIFQGFTTWKFAIRDGMQPAHVADLVKHLKKVEQAISALYTAMEKDKKRFVHIFTEIDASGDGTIDAQELLRILEGLGVTDITLDDAIGVIKRIDHDSSGVLEYTELARALKLYGRRHRIVQNEKCAPGMEASASSPEQTAQQQWNTLTPPAIVSQEGAGKPILDVNDLDPSMRRPSTREMSSLDDALAAAIKRMEEQIRVHDQALAKRVEKRKLRAKLRAENEKADSGSLDVKPKCKTKNKQRAVLKRLHESPLDRPVSPVNKKSPAGKVSMRDTQRANRSMDSEKQSEDHIFKQQLSVVNLDLGEMVFYEHMDAPDPLEKSDSLTVINMVWDDSSVTYDGIEPPEPHGDASKGMQTNTEILLPEFEGDKVLTADAKQRSAKKQINSRAAAKGSNITKQAELTLKREEENAGSEGNPQPEKISKSRKAVTRLTGPNSQQRKEGTDLKPRTQERSEPQGSVDPESASDHVKQSSSTGAKTGPLQKVQEPGPSETSTRVMRSEERPTRTPIKTKQPNLDDHAHSNDATETQVSTENAKIESRRLKIPANDQALLNSGPSTNEGTVYREDGCQEPAELGDLEKTPVKADTRHFEKLEEVVTTKATEEIPKIELTVIDQSASQLSSSTERKDKSRKQNQGRRNKEALDDVHAIHVQGADKPRKSTTSDISRRSSSTTNRLGVVQDEKKQGYGSSQQQSREEESQSMHRAHNLVTPLELEQKNENEGSREIDRGQDSQHALHKEPQVQPQHVREHTHPPHHEAQRSQQNTEQANVDTSSPQRQQPQPQQHQQGEQHVRRSAQHREREPKNETHEHQLEQLSSHVDHIQEEGNLQEQVLRGQENRHQRGRMETRSNHQQDESKGTDRHVRHHDQKHQQHHHRQEVEQLHQEPGINEKHVSHARDRGHDPNSSQHQQQEGYLDSRHQQANRHGQGSREAHSRDQEYRQQHRPPPSSAQRQHQQHQQQDTEISRHHREGNRGYRDQYLTSEELERQVRHHHSREDAVHRQNRQVQQDLSAQQRRIRSPEGGERSVHISSSQTHRHSQHPDNRSRHHRQHQHREDRDH